MGIVLDLPLICNITVFTYKIHSEPVRFRTFSSITYYETKYVLENEIHTYFSKKYNFLVLNSDQDAMYMMFYTRVKKNIK